MATQRKTELHRHLDASIRASTLAALSGRSEDEIRSKFLLKHPMRSLKEVLDCFALFQEVLRAPDVLERVAFEAVEDAFKEGIGAIELRWSPAFATEKSGLSWEAALGAFHRGVTRGSRQFGVRAGLIAIASREYGVDVAARTVDFALEHRDKFIAVDLAGDEEKHPNREFANPYRKAREAGMHVTIHAGEAAGPQSVWEAIDLCGAERIGHGITSVRDPELMKRLARDGILLEICPTSNFITNAVPSLAEHPLPRLLAAGIPCSISTDDPGIFGVTLDHEYALVKREMHLSDADLARVDAFAAEHAFQE